MLHTVDIMMKLLSLERYAFPAKCTFQKLVDIESSNIFFLSEHKFCGDYHLLQKELN